MNINFSRNIKLNSGIELKLGGCNLIQSMFMKISIGQYKISTAGMKSVARNDWVMFP